METSLPPQSYHRSQPLRRLHSRRATRPLISPASPTQPAINSNNIPLYARPAPTVAQFTFAPVTETRVVTTTTTTTHSFPPVVFPPPRQMVDLDPKVHPLARTETPVALKRFAFDIDGKKVFWKESEDGDQALYELQQTLYDLKENRGTVVKRSETLSHTPVLGNVTTSNANIRKRPASPVSLPGTNFLSRAEGNPSKRRIVSTSSVHDIRSRGNASTLEYPQTPVDVDIPIRSNLAQQSSPTLDVESLSPLPPPSYTSPHTRNMGEDEELDLLGDSTVEGDMVIEDGMISPGHSVSLPSPRLSPAQDDASPVTQYSSEDYFLTRGRENMTDVMLDTDEDFKQDNLTVNDIIASHTQGGMPIMQIPAMMDTFDNLPTNVQTYVLFQLLRRCKITTLQFAAEVIKPTLQRDFLTDLPPELGLNVLKYLDSKSLARAQLVSRKWRMVCGWDDHIWRERFQEDGFRLRNKEGGKEDIRAWPIIRTEEEKDPETIWGGYSVDPSKMEKWTARVEDRRRESFKTIYQRHHKIRSNWMDPAAKPRHISFAGHGRNVVTCLQFDEEKIVTGSDDSTVNVYDAETGLLKQTLHGHDGGVWALQYVGDVLVTGSTDRTVRVWDLESGRCTQVFYGHTSTVRCMQILVPKKVGVDKRGKDINMPVEPMVVTGSRDSTLRIWKLPKRGDREWLPAPPDIINTPIVGVAVNNTNDIHMDDDPNSPTSVVQQAAKENPYYIRILRGHTQSVRALSGWGNDLVTGSYDLTVKVWKVNTGGLVHTLRGHTMKVYSVVLDVERGRCVSGSMDHQVRIWDIRSGECLTILEGHNSLVGLLDICDDYLVSAAADSTLRVWNPEDGTLRHILSAHTGAITCFQHNENMIISGSDGTLKMWDIQTGTFHRDLLHGLSGVWQIRFDDRRCVAAVQRGGATWIDVLTFGEKDGGKVTDGGGRVIVQDAGQGHVQAHAQANAAAVAALQAANGLSGAGVDDGV